MPMMRIKTLFCLLFLAYVLSVASEERARINVHAEHSGKTDNDSPPRAARTDRKFRARSIRNTNPDERSPGDAGNYSFARQIIPTLQGRKPRGYDEIKLLADLSAATDRGAVTRALMDQPEYIDHWSDVLASQLRITIDEADNKNQRDCFETPLRTGSDRGELAGWIRSHAPDQEPAPGGAFNMADVLRSALELDDLSPVYRAHLFAMINKPITGNQITEDNKRSDFGIQFSRIFTQRQMLCIKCHNSQTSKTGPASGWNRTHPIPRPPRFFEKALYRTSQGIRPETRAFAMFRTDVNFGDVQPWGMQRCGSFKRNVPNDELNIDAYFTQELGKQATIWNVESIFRTGYEKIVRDGLGGSGPDVDGDSAFAFLVSATVVNETWAETMGYPLTIPIYFPRNTGQQGIFEELTKTQFVASRWSLRNLLTRITTTNLYNLQSPKLNGGATAYELPMIFNPWVEADPRVAPDPDPAKHFNSMADAVQRYSPRSLLFSVHRALDWPAPKRFPDDTDYPKADLFKSLGQFFKDAEPGFRGTDFQGLLHWESVHGVCAKPPGVDKDWINRLVTAIPDFDAANPSNPLSIKDAAVTVKDWLIGDSQIYSGVAYQEEKSENDLLKDFFNVSSLESTRAASVPELETKLRRYCGVLLETPQFMLSGIAPVEPGPRPRLRVCNGGPCSYSEMCETLKPSLMRQGWSVNCDGDSVSAIHDAPVVGAASSARNFSLAASDSGQLRARRMTGPADEVKSEMVASLCPQGSCAAVPWTDNALCLEKPASCRRNPPLCDPRCARIDCCGGPLPAVIEKPIAFLAWAEGGIVEESQQVRILSKGKKDVRPLAKGVVLRAGDLLQIPAQGRLIIKAGQVSFSTPESGMPANKNQSYWTFLVTGSSVLEAAKGADLSATKSSNQQVLKSDELRWGEAGQPVRKGAKQEIDETRMKGRKNKPPQR